MSAEDPAFVALCDAVLGGSATENQIRIFQDRLRESAALRQEYQMQARLHAPLLWQQGRVNDETRPHVKLRHWNVWSRPLAVAAAAAVLLAAWWAMPSREGRLMLEIVAAEAVPFTVGETVSLQSLKLASGKLTFRLASGAVVEAAGQVHLEFLDAMHLRVLQGRVTADVEDRAKGFIIDTASARVVDLGTRFAVSVGDSGDTDVVVFEGEVEVYEPLVDGRSRPRPTRLTEGEAVRVNAQHQTARLSSVALPGHGWEGVVIDVLDNVEEAGFHRYYGIAPGGMRAGTQPYSTLRRPRWQPLPGGTFPTELAGADAISTFTMDRKDRDIEITLTLARPAAVYVLLDERGPPPEWLAEGFHPTGLRLRSGPWNHLPVVREINPDAQGDRYLTFSVWKQEAPAGAVVLGPPYAKGQPSNRAMYGIAVKALP